MATAVRPPNKVLWALAECIEHDADIAELIEALINLLERENEQAKQRFDKAGRLRLAEGFATLARLQSHAARIASLHMQAKQNQYDRR